MGIAKNSVNKLAPHVTKVAPNLTSSFVNQALDKAITGIGPLAGAGKAADKVLEDKHGDVEKAIDAVIETHVRYAAGQGFLTNIGGLVTMTVTVPANIAGLALIQCRAVAAVVHLRGYDLDDPRTRAAILTCLLGEERLGTLLKKKRIPGPPMAIATSPVTNPEVSRTISGEVASELMAAAAGKRLASAVGRRVPVLGGVVGAGSDAWATWKIGRYAGREFLPRARR